MNYDKLLEKVNNLRYAANLKGEYANREIPIELQSVLEHTIDQYCITQINIIKIECENLLVEYGPKTKLPTQTDMCNPI